MMFSTVVICVGIIVVIVVAVKSYYSHMRMVDVFTLRAIQDQAEKLHVMSDKPSSEIETLLGHVSVVMSLVSEPFNYGLYWRATKKIVSDVVNGKKIQCGIDVLKGSQPPIPKLTRELYDVAERYLKRYTPRWFDILLITVALCILHKNGEITRARGSRPYSQIRTMDIDRTVCCEIMGQ